jgi:hypothetical protein
MADEYLAIAAIAGDHWMNERLRAAATQQSHAGNAVYDPDPVAWTDLNRYLWASSPGWGEKWQSALAAHPPETEPDYQPGRDMAVITDGDILATVQALGAPSSPPGRET